MIQNNDARSGSGSMEQYGADCWASLSNPAAHLAAHDGLDHAHSAVAAIAAIDPGKGFAAPGEEISRVLASDIPDGLQAVGSEARCHNGDPLNPSSRSTLYALVRVGI